MRFSSRSGSFASLAIVSVAFDCANTGDTVQRDAAADLARETSTDDITVPPTDAQDSPDAFDVFDPPSDAAATPSTSVAVWTQHNDNERTGANLAETTLTTSNVTAGNFGLLFTRAVQGQIYAQPLVVPGVAVPGHGTHDLVLVATEHNDVYAFDAVDSAAADPFWHVNLGTPMPNTVISNCADIQPDVGVTSTPVIDLAARTIFIESRTWEGGTAIDRLHALDITNGNERIGSPVVIAAAIAGTGIPGESTDGMVHYVAFNQLQRPGLLLSHGVVFLGFGSFCDREVYHGWVMAYDAATLRQVAVYNDTRNGYTAGIWQSGNGLAADDAGDVYLFTGDGTFAPDHAPPDLGDSIVRLHLDGGSLEAVDWYTPPDQAALYELDWDLGSSGPLLVPGTQLLVGGGKEGVLYVVDRSAMGHLGPGSDSRLPQSFQATGGQYGHIMTAPVTWNGPNGRLVYLLGGEDSLRAFRFDGSVLSTTPVATSASPLPSGTPCGDLSISANGSSAGTGIVWAAVPLTPGNEAYERVGALRAYDASDVGRLLWSSENDPNDTLGTWSKYAMPTIANGRVYVPTFSNRLQVYGLRTHGSM